MAEDNAGQMSVFAALSVQHMAETWPPGQHGWIFSPQIPFLEPFTWQMTREEKGRGEIEKNAKTQKQKIPPKPFMLPRILPSPFE